MSFTDTKALLAFAGWPKSTPTGQELRAWIDSVDTADTDATVSTADTAKVLNLLPSLFFSRLNR